MTFTVHDIFYTLQGEGTHAGRPAVFCRFAGCNLWTGREQDRASAICRFCDTEFRGGTKFRTAGALAGAIAALWPNDYRPRFAVLTGGEPSLQVTPALLEALHWVGFTIAIETNGTRRLVAGLDWITVSPKAGTAIAISRADEVKLVFPQAGLDPSEVRALAPRRYLQPMDGPDVAANTEAVVAYCLAHPEWSVSLQTHKILGVA